MSAFVDVSAYTIAPGDVILLPGHGRSCTVVLTERNDEVEGNVLIHHDGGGTYECALTDTVPLRIPGT